jgi:hypothetical protein
MIRKKTIFVLGAGAHCPYGFPDGGRLIRNMVLELPKAPTEKTSFRVCVERIHGDPSDRTCARLIKLRTALEYSGHTSIDSFLRTHKDDNFFVDVGRWLVAWVLMPQEFGFNFSRLGPSNHDPLKPDQDWMSFLFGRMLRGCLDSPDQFVERNNIAFVTFNYDRTLEHFLTGKLKNTYRGLSTRDAWGYVQRFQIIHIYGSLGPYDPNSRFSDDRNHDLVRERARFIQLMYEERADNPALEQFARLVEGGDAYRVVFLGFGFDPDNIAALKLTERLKSLPQGGVIASRYQVPEGEWSTMKNDMFPIQIDDRSDSTRIVSRVWDALQFLRESRALE